MPTYVYSNEGHVIEEFFPMGEAPHHLVVGGKRYDRDYGAEHPKQYTGDLWPVYSEAAGVHPDQVQTAQREWAKAGVPTEFTSDGRAVFRNKDHRGKFLKKAGLVDKKGYN